MQIAMTHNGTVTAVGDYRSLFPQTSFPDSGPNQSFLAENDCLPVTLHKPFDSTTHKLVGCQPYIENGGVVQEPGWLVVALRGTNEELSRDCPVAGVQGDRVFGTQAPVFLEALRQVRCAEGPE